MTVRILEGDCRALLQTLEAGSVNTCVTSPPYFGLRDYGHEGQMGLEPTPDEFVAGMVAVFREVRRVLRNDGTLWLNIGDSYSTHAAGKVADPMAKSTLAGVKTQEVGNASSRAKGTYRNHTLPEKNLLGIPWRLAFALQSDGWILRQDIIWSKPNPMPESVRDRCTKAHEYVFLLSKGPRYYFNQDPIREDVKPNSGQNMRAPKHDGGRGDKVVAAYADVTTKIYDEIKGANRRSVWEVATQPFAEAHFATYPPALIEPCILAGCPVGGTVLDPFFGAGTTGLVADRLQRNCIGIELNPEYAAIARKRLIGDGGMFTEIAA